MSEFQYRVIAKMSEFQNRVIAEMSELRKRVIAKMIAFHKRTIAEAIVMEKGRRTEVAVCGQKKTDPYRSKNAPRLEGSQCRDSLESEMNLEAHKEDM